MKIEQLRALLAKATPGPWKVHDCGFRLSIDGDRACGIVSEIESPTPWSSKSLPLDVMTSDARDECGHPIKPADAALIVAMRNNHEALLDVLDKAVALRNEIITSKSLDTNYEINPRLYELDRAIDRLGEGLRTNDPGDAK